MAAHGYPGEYPVGHSIYGLEDAEAAGCIVFHAGTKNRDSQILTNGGRVLAVTALGKTVHKAAEVAYAGVEKINFSGSQYRTDIGRTSTQTQRKVRRPQQEYKTRSARPTRTDNTTERKLTRGKMALKRRGSSKGF